MVTISLWIGWRFLQNDCAVRPQYDTHALLLGRLDRPLDASLGERHSPRHAAPGLWFICSSSRSSAANGAEPSLSRAEARRSVCNGIFLFLIPFKVSRRHK